MTPMQKFGQNLEIKTIEVNAEFGTLELTGVHRKTLDIFTVYFPVGTLNWDETIGDIYKFNQDLGIYEECAIGGYET